MSSLPPDDDKTVIRPSASPQAAPPQTAMPITAAPPTPGVAAAPTTTTADHGAALPVGTYLGEFELTQVLGEGGFGIVYLAWDHSLERKVALKEYIPSSLASRGGGLTVQVKSERHRETFLAGMKSFVNEAKLLAQFDHPSLVKVYRFWEANGTAYMVMPFYEGITLKDRLKEMSSPPDEAWLIGLLAPLTEALAVIHSENCFHRDIAPDNVILLAGTGKPLLLDFGAARRVIGDMTQALTVILKPGYAPVEQYAEAPGMKQGPWTDVYALAASIYFAILGKTPPPSVSRLLTDSYVPLVESCAGRYSERFLSAIDHALAVRPEERTQDVHALRADLGLNSHAVKNNETQLLLGDAAPAAPTARATTSAKAANTGDTTNRKNATKSATPSETGSSKTAIWMGAGSLMLGLGGLAFYLTRPVAPLNPPAANTASAASANVAASQPSTPAPPPPTNVVQTPPPPPPPETFDVRREFDRVIASQTAGFDVGGEPVKSQLSVSKNDLLRFKVKSSRDGFVTVLVRGPDGSLTQLVPSQQMRNVRIKANQTLTLPPSDIGIGTSEPTGPEQFLVIVSSAPRDFGSLNPKEVDGYLSLPTDASAAAAAARLPAGVPALLGAAKGCSTGDCNSYGAASFTIDVVR